MLTEIKIWPWDFNSKPYWVNPDNGLEWFIDKGTTEWCTREKSNLPKLEAVSFYVVKNTGGKRKVLSIILIDKETNTVLAEKTGIVQMTVYIDMLRVSSSYDGIYKK